MSNASSSTDLTGSVERVTEQVTKVPLPLPLDELKVVNAYLVTAPDGLTLIDPGWAYAPTESTLLAALDSFGATPRDVTRILATHQHWDHYSMGVEWRDQYGIELMLGYEERHSIAAFRSLAGVHPTQVGMLHQAGAAALAEEVARLDWEPYERDVRFAEPDRWLHDGDVIDCGDTTLIARATPGHTRGHFIFDDVGHRMIFTGDHLLPKITPSIAYERAPEKLPLRSYLDSLQLLVGLADSRMLPAHGTMERGTRERALELVEHHRRRLDEIRDHVDTGAVTAFEVATRMRWTRQERALDELNVVHRMSAVLEVQSHLNLLVTQQVLRVNERDDVAEFKLA